MRKGGFMRRRAIIAALLPVSVGIVLGATVFRTDIAQATGLAQSVTVDNTAANPVPVKEQNTDPSAAGAIKVHEQGTANVQGAVSALPVAPASAWARTLSLLYPLFVQPVLYLPQSEPINVTSLTISPDGGATIRLNLIEVGVPATATACPDTGQGGDLIWVASGLSSPLAVSFPTPLQIGKTVTAAGNKVCLIAEVTGPAYLSASGFFGN